MQEESKDKGVKKEISGLIPLSTKFNHEDEEKVVIIQNSESENGVIGLDHSVLKYVKQLLLETDNQQSVVIVNQGDNVIDDQMSCPKEPALQKKMSSVTDSDVLPAASSPSGNFWSNVANDIGTGMNLSSSGDQKIIKLTVPNHICHEGNTSQSSSPVKSSLSASSLSISKTLSNASTSSGIKIESKTDISTASDHLLQLAQKIISDRNFDALQKSTSQVDLQATQGNVCRSESSVITMYLSSPNELKDRIETLKDDSPIVVLQAHADNAISKGQDVNDSVRVPKSEVESPTEDQSVTKAVSTITIIQPDSQCKKEASPSTRSNEDMTVCSNSTTSTVGSTYQSGESVMYKCQECGYSSHNKHYYKQHVDLVHNQDRPYKCPHCDYAGKRRHALLEHMVVHSNNRPFTCGHCNASFRKKGHLTNHIKLHTSQRLVHCGVCNIQLPDSEAFEAHLRKIHKTNKLYKCKLCDHTVVDREAMIKHFQTHSNEVVLYACPICDCHFNSEGSLEEHQRTVHGPTKIPSSSPQSVPVNAGGASEKNLKTLLPNIICSECGFVCSDQGIMQKHMWSHIKSEAKHDDNQNKGNDLEASKENSIGVLKKSIDSGQKTLPKNVFYQCTSCSLTCSDTSTFIKHMLAHKTQEKHQKEAIESSALVDVQDEQEYINQLQFSSDVAVKDMAENSSGSHKSDNSVPFVYDKVAARFRCLICNYHCEFQRTIKAHIWKHSGHQGIEYPTFDQSGNTTSGSIASWNVSDKQGPLSTAQTVLERNSVNATPNQGGLPVFKTRSGDMVHLIPVDPSKTNFKPGELVQIKDSTVIIPDKSSLPKVSNLPQSSATLKKADYSSIKTIVPQKGDKEVSGKEDSSKQTISSLPVIKKDSNTHESMLPKILRLEEEPSSEPSVVVEVVNAVPSGYNLTGMKSQQGSPRVHDLDSSGGDSKLGPLLGSREGLEDCLETASATTLELKPDQSIGDTGGKELLIKAQDRKLESLAKLRCPLCDTQILGDLKGHLMGCKVKQTKEIEVSNQAIDQQEDIIIKETKESHLAEDTDSTESSDETTTGEVSEAKKSGICSSLLAVIEQLRERSRSESEEDKRSSQPAKRSRKKVRNTDLSPDSLDNIDNIEKISGASPKFRCSLCHYTSERVYNMKLHMKTHRQKKSSECSLCDFSSSSQAVLQEHMLRHCKVRTYACKFCPQSFNHKSTLRAHQRAHKDQEPYLCAYCVFETHSAQEYRDHMQVHSGCSSRLRCPGCDLVLASKDELTAHLLTCKGNGRANRSCYEVPSDKSTKVKSVHENSINLDTKSDQKMQQQCQRQSGDETAGGEEETGTDLQVSQHACVVNGCSFSSPSLKELQEHLGVHCNPSLLMCDLCDFRALHSRSLKSHMKRHANDQRYVQQPLEQYKCNLCGYVCHHLPSLKSHMWRHASDQSYSYEFTNDVINAAIDHDTRVDSGKQADDPELLDQVINSERKILEGELTKCKGGDGQRPICWVTFRCCSCGFETINKAKLNIHMRTHSDLIQQAQALDMIPRRKRPVVEDRIQLGPSPKAVKTKN